MEKYLLSCDWGSTAFRLRLIEVPGQVIIGEIFSDEGVTRTFNNWKANAADKEITRKQYFINILKKQKDLLAANVSVKLDGIPIAVSGMASSSIGMQELPYAILPFPVSGSGAIVQIFEAEENFPNPILLISGVRSDEEVMRGEETQLIGIAELLGLQQQEAILILPGTHSKHLHIKNGHLVDFKTFMTGEVFGLMINHSILKNSVDTGDWAELSESDEEAFRLGVDRSTVSSILNSLFSIRTNELFNKMNKRQNSLYLSGLLIGNELSTLRSEDVTLGLCSSGNLLGLYRLALDQLGLLKNTILVSASCFDKAVAAGQIAILNKLTLTL